MFAHCDLRAQSTHTAALLSLTAYLSGREPSKHAPALDTRRAPLIQDAEERDADLERGPLPGPPPGPLHPFLNRVGRLQTPVVAMLAAAGLLGDPSGYCWC